MRRGLTFGLLVLAACGGTISAGGQGEPDASDGAASSDDGATSKCIAGTARICAPDQGCPVLPSATCPGTGCKGVVEVDGGSTADGVCWSDLSDLGNVSCASCDDGQSCIGRNGQFVCVPNGVCQAFWKLGIQDVCLYADKHAYDGRDLPPEPTTCPGGLSGQGILCGGACGACRSDEAQRCVGRSPDHPVGVCAWLPPTASPQDPATIPICSLAGTTYRVPCPGAPAGLACGVFSPSTPMSEQYGLCMPPDMCKTLASDLPGGFDCYDVTGSLIAGQ